MISTIQRPLADNTTLTRIRHPRPRRDSHPQSQLRLSRTKGHNATATYISMKNFSDTIGNRARDLPACTAVLPVDNVQSKNVSWSSLYTRNVFALSAQQYCRLPGSFQFAQEMQWVINLFYTLFSKCKQLPTIMQEESLKQSYSITASETAETLILSSSDF